MYKELIDNQIFMYIKDLAINFVVKPLLQKNKNEFEFSAQGDLALNVVEEDSPPGRLFNCTNDIIIDLPDALTLSVFSSGVKSIVDFKDTKGNIYHLGSESYPAVVYISPRLNSATLKVISKSPLSPFIL